MSLWGDMLSFLWSKYLWVEWLGYTVSVCLTFQETTKLDPKYTVALCESSISSISL